MIWEIEIGESILSTVFNRCPFLEDFIEILISNGPYMIIKNAKNGEFGILWIHNFEKYIFFSDIIEEKEAFPAYPEQRIFYNSKMGLGSGLGNTEFYEFMLWTTLIF